MLRTLTDQPTVPQEGALFKKIELAGKTFEIRYGFYNEEDRRSRYAEPVAIYPDFEKEPLYADNGMPFATAMQVPCGHFDGRCDEDSGCGDCGFYRYGEELLGLCTCPRNRKNE